MLKYSNLAFRVYYISVLQPNIGRVDSGNLDFNLLISLKSFCLFKKG